MDNSAPSRPRGLNFLLGGVLVAVCLLSAGIVSGQINFGFGAPEVRIDGR